MLRTLIQRAAVVSALLLGISPQSRAQTTFRIAGALSNFDCWNNTETETEGFEIELEGIHKEEVVHTWNYSRFGAPVVVDGGTAAAPTAIVRYHSNTAFLLPSEVTHFGVSLLNFRPAAAVHYRWLPKVTVAVPNPVPVSVMLPPHGSSVTTTNGIPMVQDVITNNAPAGGPSIWVLPFAHVLPGSVALEELMSDNPVTHGGSPHGGGTNGTHPERLDPGDSWTNDDNTASGEEASLVYTFEIYEDIVTIVNHKKIHTMGRKLSDMMDATITTSGPVVPNQLNLSHADVYGGQSLTGTVYLNGLAPAGGLVVTLHSNDLHAALPASVTVPQGMISAPFAIQTTPVSQTTSVSLSAADAASTVPAVGTLTISPPALTTLYLAYAVNFGGLNFDGAVYLGSPAPLGGTIVTLQSSNASAASIPASVTVPAGQTIAHFNVQTGFVTAQQTVVIRAALNAGTLTQNLLVAPSPRKITGHLTLQGAGKPTHTLTLVLHPNDGSGNVQTTLTLAGDGQFTLAGVPAKAYVLGVKASHWLQRITPCNLTTNDASEISLSLLNGDVDGSNAVNVDDLTLLLNAYNSAQGDSVYNGQPNADLNENGTIDVDDLTLLLNNYNTAGEIVASRKAR